MKNKEIKFTKMTAGGNDFVMIDNRGLVIKDAPDSISSLVKKLCDRKFSVGADGVIFLENSQKNDFKMRYFNADGGEVPMCGNGARCISMFAKEIGASIKSKGAFETQAGTIHYEILKDTVKILLSEPKNLRVDFPLKVEKREFNISYINTGVPHVVVFVDNIEKVDVGTIGRMIRYHREFAPEGSNANFVSVKDRSTIIVRTYERGVEAETLACGTGVTAAAIISALKKLVVSPVNCKTRGGDILTVSFKLHEDDLISPVSSVYLEGPVTIAFQGQVKIRL